MTSTPRVHRLHAGIPLLRRIEEHPWENRVTFNPACAFIDERSVIESIVPSLPFDGPTKALLLEQEGLCFLLYRAQGAPREEYDYTRSSMGLAVLGPGLDLLARHDRPVMLPDQPYEDLGVEDARITRVGDTFYAFYTAYRSGTPENQVRIAIASTRDFFHWEKHGLLKGNFNGAQNKNAMLFPGKINGKYIMLHRPMTGPERNSIHWAESNDVLGPWKTRGLLMKPLRNTLFADTWTGGGAPPLLLGDGRYLIIYHNGNRKADGTRMYELAIAIGDPRAKGFITRRDEPLMSPETPAETLGDEDLGVNNVIFACGAYFYKNDLYLPYAGADSVVAGAMIPADEISRYAADR